MKKNILWEATDHPSLEHCVLNYTTHSIEISSVIIGKSKNNIYRLDYSMTLDKKWELKTATINIDSCKLKKKFMVKRSTNGNWFLNNKIAKRFHNCTEIDISLTPFTNSLPINRIGFIKGQDEKIKVIYFDILEGKVKPVMQRYTRLTSSKYRFQNIPNDFEAVIRIDKNGLVNKYPALFKQIKLQ